MRCWNSGKAHRGWWLILFVFNVIDPICNIGITQSPIRAKLENARLSKPGIFCHQDLVMSFTGISKVKARGTSPSTFTAFCMASLCVDIVKWISVNHPFR